MTYVLFHLVIFSSVLNVFMGNLVTGGKLGVRSRDFSFVISYIYMFLLKEEVLTAGQRVNYAQKK